MRVLVACEFSGVVRRAFAARGHDAWSCDLLPAEDGSDHHIQGDALAVLDRGWDLMVAFPPCTHLCSSGARWWPAKQADGRQAAALDFVRALMAAPIPRWAIENPVGLIGTAIRPADQTVHPWQFGHGETKATCLWLHGLSPLVPTNIVSGRVPRVHFMSPSDDRARERSRTYQGIGDAMADQWGAESLPLLAWGQA